MPLRSERVWDFTPGFHVIPEIFTAEECSNVIALHTDRKAMEARAKAGKDSYRDTNVFWLPPDEEPHKWVYERVAEFSLQLNDEHYRFEVDSCTDLQLARYLPGQHYDWHTDLGTGGYSRRKLSIAVMLSPAEEFDGGELEFGGDKFTRKASLQQGGAVVFPSWLRHRVTPVDKGARWSLVGWWLGPPFR